MKTIYEQLGVDPGKESIRKIFGGVVNNDFPGAFVNIVHLPWLHSWVGTMHNDGDGSKSVNRMVYYLETGDDSIFSGIVDDAFSMNSGDIAAAGFVQGNWMFTDIINVNLPSDLKEIVLLRIAKRFTELKQLYNDHGFNNIFFMGGETADLPDQVRPQDITFDMGLQAQMPARYIIKGNVSPGDVIYGFASDGQAKWETEFNFGPMSNGYTMYRRFGTPYSFNSKYPNLNRDNNFYRGVLEYNKLMSNGVPLSLALLSPTRQWALVIKKIVDKLIEKNCFDLLHGIVFNTGGGATKIKHLGKGGIMYVKKMPKPPEFFQLMKEESGESWAGLFQTGNCGVGIDVVGQEENAFIETLQEVSAECEIKLFDLGHCEKGEDIKKNKVKLNSQYGIFTY